MTADDTAAALAHARAFAAYYAITVDCPDPVAAGEDPVVTVRLGRHAAGVRLRSCDRPSVYAALYANACALYRSLESARLTSATEDAA